MKKIITLAAAVSLVGICSAAAVNWNTGALYTPNADGTWSTSEATSSVGTWAATVAFFADNDGVKGAALTGITNTSKNGVNDYTHALNASSKDFTTSTYYWAVLEITYTTPTAEAQTLTLDPYRFKTAANGGTSLNFQSAGVLDNSHTFSPASVPEPTSGLLLLIGMAGLALKRKVA